MDFCECVAPTSVIDATMAHATSLPNARHTSRPCDAGANTSRMVARSMDKHMKDSVTLFCQARGISLSAAGHAGSERQDIVLKPLQHQAHAPTCSLYDTTATLSAV